MRALLLLAAGIAFLCFHQNVEAIPRFFMGRWVDEPLRDTIFDAMMGLPRRFNQRPGQDDESVCPDNPNKKLTIGWYEQPLDHFGNTSTAKWQQHYQISDQFFNKRNKTDAPVIFLQIGGEGPINNKWVCFENYTYMVAAANYSAKVIQLEHRFFGKNKGLKDLSTDSLKYLTTEQALADINSFIQWYNKQNNFTNPKWVAFGGSYPGTMAALLRLVYPNITQGNIASSGPMLPTVDYWQYGYVMETTINATSKDCYNEVKSAFQELVTNTLTKTGRQKLNSAFHIKLPGLDVDNPRRVDIDTVTSNVFGAFQGVIQYTYDGAADRYENKDCPRLNIKCACNIMTDTTSTPDAMDRLYKVWQLSTDNQEFVAKYEDSIADLLNVDLAGRAADMRGWMWLSCNEFGWLQSTSNNALFGDTVPISYYIQMCSDLFDGKLGASEIDARIEQTLKRYGFPENYNGTNVFLPNGAFDPWSALGVKDKANDTNRANQRIVTRLTPGAAHCSDMYPPYDGEPEGLKKTREMFYTELAYYLSLDSVFTENKGNGASAMMIPSAVLVALIALTQFLMH